MKYTSIINRATKNDNLKMVPYWARKKPSDPCYILSLIFLISSEPVSCFIIQLATKSDDVIANAHIHIESVTNVIAYVALNILSSM